MGSNLIEKLNETKDLIQQKLGENSTQKIKKLELEIHSLFLNCFFSTSERTGIVIFREELDFARRRLFDLASDAKKMSKIELFEKMFVEYKDTYSKPIKDEAEFIRNLPAFEKSKKSRGLENSNLQTLNIKQLQDIMGGVLELNKDGSIYFKPYKTKGLKLTLDQVSSSVRSRNC